MKILLSNDDGIYAPGLRSLYRALIDAGHEVVTVAPAMEQSGVSSALSARGPLQARPVREDGFSGYAALRCEKHYGCEPPQERKHRHL